MSGTDPEDKPKPPDPPDPDTESDPSWEIVGLAPDDHTERMSVAGGWMYRNTSAIRSPSYRQGVRNWSSSVVFVPDTTGPTQLPAMLPWQRFHDAPNGGYTDRMDVPGGSLYRNALLNMHQGYGEWFMTMVFVPG